MKLFLLEKKMEKFTKNTTIISIDFINQLHTKNLCKTSISPTENALVDNVRLRVNAVREATAGFKEIIPKD